MAKIHNLEELNRDLHFGDYVFFSTEERIIEYIIRDCFLENGYNNSEIFNILGINEEKKYEIAEKHYRYKVKHKAISISNWPEFKENDYQAAERLIRAIYILLGEKNIIYEPINSRFEILDL